MHYRPCDELGTDLVAAQSMWQCRLQPAVAERLVEYITERYPAKEAFETLLERALDVEFILDEAERHAYKYMLGIFFNKRVQASRKRNEEMNAIPFAPR